MVTLKLLIPEFDLYKFSLLIIFRIGVMFKASAPDLGLVVFTRFPGVLNSL